MIDLPALLHQAEYLLAEINVLRGVIIRMPDPVLNARIPPTNRSVKEYYGAIVDVTALHALPELENPDIAGDWPEPASIELTRDWNGIGIELILDELAEGRRRLLELLPEEPGPATVGVAQRLVRFDLEAQRLVTERLFDAQPEPPSGGKDAP